MFVLEKFQLDQPQKPQQVVTLKTAVKVPSTNSNITCEIQLLFDQRGF